MSDKKQETNKQLSEKNEESKLRLEKVYIPPELKEYGNLTSLTAGGSGMRMEAGMGTAVMKRP